VGKRIRINKAIVVRRDKDRTRTSNDREIELLRDRCDESFTSSSLNQIHLSERGLEVPDEGIVAVSVDIKPRSSRNSVNPKSNGWFALLSWPQTDSMPPSSILWGAKKAHDTGHIKDVNDDGDSDLVLHFKTRATGIKCGDTSASLTGATFNGDLIKGTDIIRTVGCKR
jgi:hypothetical protein